MAKLTTKQRNSLPGKSFALPGRRYPINNPSHARNALSRVSENGTPKEKAKVRAAVHRKYPSIGRDGRHMGAHSSHQAMTSQPGKTHLKRKAK